MRGILHIPENARIEHNERGYEVYYRTGVVISVGPGDRAIGLWCRDCRDAGIPWTETRYSSTIKTHYSDGETTGRRMASCPRCGSKRTAIISHSEHRPMELEPGDHILYLQRPGSEVFYGDPEDGKEYVVLHEDAETGQHVLGVIE